MPIAAARAETRASRRGAQPDSVTRQRRHRRALVQLARTGIPFLIGGGYALRHYTKGVRDKVRLTATSASRRR